MTTLAKKVALARLAQAAKMGRFKRAHRAADPTSQHVHYYAESQRAMLHLIKLAREGVLV